MIGTSRRVGSGLLLFLITLLIGRPARAADQWLEMKSPHFTIVSNAGKGTTATLAWQLEQVRSEIAAIWPWAHLELNTPLVVFALKDEQTMKTFAPAFWEKKNNSGAASVWTSGYQRTFLALRTDVEQDAKRLINPYASSYFAYFSLILQQSVPTSLPPWFERGVAAVMSNTVIQDGKILIGPPIPWYLDSLREGPRIPLPDLVAARSGSPLLKGDNLRLFDAQAWALVHYLMFAEKGARSAALGRFTGQVTSGMDPDKAFRETLGAVSDLMTPVSGYIDRSIYSYIAVQADAEVKRDAFAVSPIAAAQSAAWRALVLVTMRRPVEARAAIDDARKAGGAADVELAEALLLDQDGKDEAARAAFTRAIDAGSSDSYAHYRLASLLWRADADRDLLTRLQQLLAKATALNPRYAAAYDFRADIESALGMGDPSGLALRAVALEPSNPHHHYTAARVLANAHRFDEALKHVDLAAEMAESDTAAREAAQLKIWIQRQKQ